VKGIGRTPVAAIGDLNPAAIGLLNLNKRAPVNERVVSHFDRHEMFEIVDESASRRNRQNAEKRISNAIWIDRAAEAVSQRRCFDNRAAAH
jgi:hypothetical protein